MQSQMLQTLIDPASLACLDGRLEATLPDYKPLLQFTQPERNLLLLKSMCCKTNQNLKFPFEASNLSPITLIFMGSP